MKKIPTLYVREFDDNGKIISVIDYINPALDGIGLSKLRATEKIDGSCTAIIDGRFYKRFDAKHGKPIPEGAIKCQDEADPITGHLPCWVLVTDSPADKWYLEAYRNTPDYRGLKDGTYEAVGKHFNGNKYHLECDILVPHGVMTIYGFTPDYDGIKKYLTDHRIEGIVFWDEEKPVCKIKRSDFGLEWK